MTVENQIKAIDIRIALLEARNAMENARIVKKLQRKRRALEKSAK
jgi:hypothetical protein